MVIANQIAGGILLSISRVIGYSNSDMSPDQDISIYHKNEFF
jgi:hypothetical protein